MAIQILINPQNAFSSKMIFDIILMLSIRAKKSGFLKMP
jgi:hypothetical protein